MMHRLHQCQRDLSVANASIEGLQSSASLLRDQLTRAEESVRKEQAAREETEIASKNAVAEAISAMKENVAQARSEADASSQLHIELQSQVQELNRQLIQMSSDNVAAMTTLRDRMRAREAEFAEERLQCQRQLKAVSDREHALLRLVPLHVTSSENDQAVSSDESQSNISPQSLLQRLAASEERVKTVEGWWEEETRDRLSEVESIKVTNVIY